MNRQLVHPDFGSVKLATRDGSLIKRALICRTGSFEGMNGPVEVTEDMLEEICHRYVSDKAKPQNENDYAPILVDHVRLTDNVKGRVLSDNMELAPWKGPDGKEYVGLYGDLRIDDPDAQKNVASGKYSQLSMGFDEETFELYEVSFVAVPAAKGSTILSKGGKNMNYQQKLSLVTKKHNALAAAVRDQRTKRKALLAKMFSTKVSLAKEAAELGKSIEAMSSTIKVAQLKARFSEFVRQGRMTPVELKELDLKTLAQLSTPAVDAIVKSYAGRTPSDDVFMFGQTSDEIAITADLSPKAMREAIKLQKEGKKATTLAAVDGVLSEEEEKAKKLAADKEKEKSLAMGDEDHKEIMAHMEAAHKSLKACMEKMGSMGKLAEEVSDEDKKKLADSEDDEPLADDEEEAKRLADEEEKAKKLADEEEKAKKLADEEEKAKKLAAEEDAKNKGAK